MTKQSSLGYFNIYLNFSTFLIICPPVSPAIPQSSFQLGGGLVKRSKILLFRLCKQKVEMDTRCIKCGHCKLRNVVLMVDRGGGGG